jgi:hypothetical protein
MAFGNQLRLIALGLCAAATLFWLYTFYHIAQLPAGDGSGFQWIAEVPLTGIFLLCILPAFALAWFGRTIVLAVGLATLGLVLDAILWSQLLTEFQPG